MLKDRNVTFLNVIDFKIKIIFILPKKMIVERNISARSKIAMALFSAVFL